MQTDATIGRRFSRVKGSRRCHSAIETRWESPVQSSELAANSPQCLGGRLTTVTNGPSAGGGELVRGQTRSQSSPPGDPRDWRMMSGLPVGSKTCIFDIDGSSDIDGKTMQPDVSFLGFPVEPARTRSFFADRSDSSRSPFPAGNLANATRNLTANPVSIGDASLSVESLEN